MTFASRRCGTVAGIATAIRDMWVRGAPLIGVTAAYGVAIQMEDDPSDAALDAVWDTLHETRPTAINLRWALDEMRARPARHCRPNNAPRQPTAAPPRSPTRTSSSTAPSASTALRSSEQIAARKKPGEPVNILTHCNAGWLATVDYGTATAPIYLATEAGIPVHVYVDETRPRNQGAQLTAWEMAGHGVPHTLIVDNAGGHLMQRGEVDMVIVGTDRTTASGDVCNKIGTYLKALAAHDNGVPFYVGAAVADHRLDGPRRSRRKSRSRSAPATRCRYVWGKTASGEIAQVRISPEATPAANPAFDVTPARLVTGLITERGIAKASREGLKALFPERG